MSTMDEEVDPPISTSVEKYIEMLTNVIESKNAEIEKLIRIQKKLIDIVDQEFGQELREQFLEGI